MTEDTLLPDAQLWRYLYRAAVLETNMDLVPRRVLEARKAAGERALHLIREAADDDPELLDIGICKSGLGRIEQQMSVRERFETQSVDPGTLRIGGGKDRHLCLIPVFTCRCDSHHRPSKIQRLS